jgi:hypothetical protein
MGQARRESICLTGRGGRSLVPLIIALALAAGLLPVGLAFLYGARTIHDLLGENKELKQAIANLTHEEQIGYAKVVSQEKRDGRPYTTLKFVETARGNKLERILEKQFTIEGDVVHFDALIVSFGDKMVMDGRQKALYLWRRIYGESMAPADGFAIEEAGKEPKRYADLLGKLRLPDREMFWTAIWDLANDPDKLRQYDIKGVYGNAVYTQLRPGLVYVFKISPTGQVYPETVPEM